MKTRLLSNYRLMNKLFFKSFSDSSENRFKAFILLKLDPKVKPSIQHIKSNYNKLVHKYHPDLVGKKETDKDKIKEYAYKFSEITE